MKFRFGGQFLLLVFLFALLPEASAIAKPAIRETEWQELTKDKAFDYKDEKELSGTPKQASADNFLSRAIGNLLSFFSSVLGKTILWLFVFLIISFALLKIILLERTRFGKQKKGAAPGPSSDTVPTEDLLLTNWEKNFDEALREKNTRLAIRYSYMLLLQLLQERHLILFRPDKTNYEYYYELNENDLKDSFRQLLRQYEFAWYGNYYITPEKLNHYLETFNQLRSRLRQA